MQTRSRVGRSGSDQATVGRTTSPFGDSLREFVLHSLSERGARPAYETFPAGTSSPAGSYLKCRLKLRAIGECTGLSPMGNWVVPEAPRRRYWLRAESMFRSPVPARGKGRVDELPVRMGRGVSVSSCMARRFTAHWARPSSAILSAHSRRQRWRTKLLRSGFNLAKRCRES